MTRAHRWPFSALVLGALLTTLLARPAQAQYPYMVKVGNVAPQLWVPPNVARLKGVMAFADWLLAPGWAGSADFRALATRLEVGVVLVKDGNLFGAYPGRCKSGEFENIPMALVELGKMSNHPELATAPIIGVGHSHGGDYWNWFNACKPERVAMIFCKSCGGVEYGGAALKTPILQEIGMNDLNETGSGKPRAGMFVNRSKGATMALVLGPGEQHMDFGAGARAMVLELLEALARPRLAEGGLREVDESTGWLGDNYTKAIAPFAMFTGPKGLSSFLPTMAIADHWKAFGGMLPASVKIPTDTCGWCGQPTDEPPATPSVQPDAGTTPSPADAGAAGATDTAPAADAGTSPPVTKPDAAAPRTSGDAAGAPDPDPARGEEAPRTSAAKGGCSYGQHPSASGLALGLALLVLHARRRVRR
jgi:hypothetical protein